MRAQTNAPSMVSGQVLLRALVGLLAVAMLGSWPASPQAHADPRLDRAEAQQRETQRALDEVLARIDRLEAEVGAVEAQLTALTDREQAQRAQAEQASGAVALQARESYKHGASDPLLSLFASGSLQEASQQARLLAFLARRNEAGRESASAARVRTLATTQQVEQLRGQLRERQTALDAARADAAAHVAAAERQVSSVQATLAAEQAAREQAQREREARLAAASRAARRPAGEQQAQQPARSAATTRAPAAAAPASGSRGGSPAAAAPATGGVACPVGSPRSYSDTWGAARSGGRSHKGTDILAPRGTPIYAYENGTITRMNGNRLGGISLYLRGASGALYYYTHLQGYAGGVSVGSSVSAGQHIAFNGDTGNAAGIPHLHFEVMPGGGGNVNPYPYVRRACG